MPIESNMVMCHVCGASLIGKRHGAVTCGDTCRQKLCRDPDMPAYRHPCKVCGTPIDNRPWYVGTCGDSECRRRWSLVQLQARQTEPCHG